MDTNTIGEVQLEQIPPSFRPHDQKQKSHWAIILIVLAVIGAGAFWYVQNETILSAMPIPAPVSPATSVRNDMPTDLEAAVGNIEIGNYSESL